MSGNSQPVNEIFHNLDPSHRLQFNFYQDETVLEQSGKIFASLKQEVGFIKVKQILWKMLSGNSSITADSISEQIQTLLTDTRCKATFETLIHKIYQNNYLQQLQVSPSLPMIPVRARTSANERVDHIQHVRQQWELGLLEELSAILTEAKRPFLMLRESGNRNPFLSQVESPDNNSESVKFLYDSEDLMETLLSIRNPNMKRDYVNRFIGLVKLSIVPEDYNQLLKKFMELTYSYAQLGVDDLHLHPGLPPAIASNSLGAAPPVPPTGSGSSSTSNIQTGFKFIQSRHEEGEWIIQYGTMLEAQLYLRRGCPPALRNKIWRIACGLLPEKPSLYEEQLYHSLRIECDRLDLLSDELFMYDIQTILDDPRFFVFEEELKEIIFCFSRDATIRQQIVYEVHQPWLQQMGLEFPADTAAPPSGVQPYLGFTTYFAPLCYLFKSKIMLYSICKYFFCQLWCRCNVLASDENTLIHYCKTFEGLLWSSHPKLFLHLVNLNLQPIKIAFPWIQLGFVGLLEMDQILMLWERVLGFHDPMLLVVAAVAIFVHRSEMLLRCASDVEATTILTEGSRLHIIPIIQAFLLRDGRNPN